MKLFAILALATLSLSAAAQTCYVDMVHTPSGRVVRSFVAYGDPNTCVEGMKECRKSIRLDYSANPSYPNGTLDCVRAGDYGPVPQPQPNPFPNPRPTPGPGPRPTPGPIGRAIDSSSLIMDVMNVLWDSEVKTKVAEGLILNMNLPALHPIVGLCSSTRTWAENATCISNAVSRAPRDLADENSAIFAVGRSCTVTKTWSDEKNCFATAANHIQSIQYLAQTCAGMWNTESASRCYRQVFGAQ